MSSKHSLITKHLEDSKPSADTRDNTLVQNSQNTLESKGDLKPLFKDANVFDRNQYHINLVDNSPVPKIQQVEYEIEPAVYEEDTVMTGVSDSLLTKEDRPFKSLDQVFEKRMNQRMAVFHCSLTDRTQFDRDLLNKQLDLEVLNINCVS